MRDEELYELAKGAMANSYAPYSNFTVGAAVLAGSGRVYTGCNVENSSLGLSICAERAAIFNAISSGEKSITAVAIACEPSERCQPCGACRQVIWEFGRDARVITKTEGGLVSRSIDELLKEPFALEAHVK